MDTDIGTPTEYNPQLVHEEPLREEQYYFQPPPPPAHIVQKPPPDLFANLDKTAYLVIFAAFILGFFMGKTMQPVILRHG